MQQRILRRFIRSPRRRVRERRWHGQAERFGGFEVDAIWAAAQLFSSE